MIKDSQRGFFGIIIPKEILDDQELNITEKFIYGYIASFTRCCFETNEAIAEKLGISESTIKHAIPKLVNKGYFYIEKKNNNNAARRIYSVFDNPKKLRYLAQKGMFEDAKKSDKPVENSGDESCKNCTRVVQNMHEPVQNMHYSKTGVSSAKYAHIDIEENKNKVKSGSEDEQKPNNTSAGLAGRRPASRLDIRRSDFESDDDYEKAFYQRNTVYLGVN